MEKLELRKELESKGVTEIYDTDELQTKFKVLSFLAPYCVALDKDTGIKVVLRFNHSPRLYWV